MSIERFKEYYVEEKNRINVKINEFNNNLVNEENNIWNFNFLFDVSAQTFAVSLNDINSINPVILHFSVTVSLTNETSPFACASIRVIGNASNKDGIKNKSNIE